MTNTEQKPAVTWTHTKSCCGSKASIASLNRAVRKSSLKPFADAGWFVSDTHAKMGIFYVKKGSFVATAAFGATQVHVRCGSDGCDGLMQEFSEII